MFHVSHIGELIQAYQDKHGASDRALALRIGVTATLIGKWKHGNFVELPKKDKIEALADQIGIGYPRALEAFLLDVGYLSEGRDGDDRDAAPTNAVSVMRDRVTGTDLSGLPSVAHKKPQPKRRDES